MRHYEEREPEGKDDRDIIRHDRETEYIVRMRKEDRSTWAKVEFLRERYWPVAYAIVLFLIALGFDFKTPAQSMKNMKEDLSAQIKASDAHLQIQIDSMKQRQDASFNDRVDQRKMLEFNTRLLCSTVTEREKERLGGVEACDAANNPTRHAAEAKIRAPGEPN